MSKATFHDERKIVITVTKWRTNLDCLENKLLVTELEKVKPLMCTLEFLSKRYETCNQNLENLTTSQKYAEDKYNTINSEMRHRESILKRIDDLIFMISDEEEMLCKTKNLEIRTASKAKNIIEAYNALAIGYILPPSTSKPKKTGKLGLQKIYSLPLDLFLKTIVCNFYVIEKVEVNYDLATKKRIQKKECFDKIYTAISREEIESVKAELTRTLKNSNENKPFYLNVVLIPKKEALPFYEGKYGVIFDNTTRKVVSVSSNIKEWRNNKPTTYNEKLGYKFLTARELLNEFNITVSTEKETSENKTPLTETRTDDNIIKPSNLDKSTSNKQMDPLLDIVKSKRLKGDNKKTASRKAKREHLEIDFNNPEEDESNLDKLFSSED